MGSEEGIELEPELPCVYFVVEIIDIEGGIGLGHWREGETEKFPRMRE